MTWNALKGERYAYSGFFAEQPAVTSRAVADPTQTIRLDSAFSSSTESGYSSASNAELTRVVTRVKRTRTGTAAIEICG